MVAREAFAASIRRTGRRHTFNQAMPLTRPALRCGSLSVCHILHRRQPTVAPTGTPAPDQVRHRATTRNIGTSTRVSLSEAPVRDDEWNHSMTKSKLLGLAVILAAAIATPVLAAGETTTRPWSAPVGHRQPRAADVPTSVSASQQTLDQEDANVDRKISNVCRGC